MKQPKYITIQIRLDTRPKLRLLAAMRGETIMDTIEKLVSESMERMQREERLPVRKNA